MNYRIARIEEDVDISTAGHDTIPVEFKDVCSRFVFDFSYKNYTAIGDGFLDHPAAMFEKVELVDGSDVFVSLTGKELFAMMAYENPNPGYHINYPVFNSTGRITFNLDFGRYLYDRDMAFDPNRLSNPTIKLEWDMAKLNANEVSLVYNFDAYLFDERVVTPAGILMRKKIEEWTPTQAAPHTVTMPTDFKYRTMWLYGYGKNQALTNPRGIPSSIAEFKLSENQDKRIPMDVDMREYLRQLETQYGLFRERFECSPNITSGFYVLASEQMKALATPSDASYPYTSVTEGNRLLVQAGGAGAGQIFGESFGQAPLHLACVPFGDQMDPDDWYDVVDMGSLKLKTKAKNEVLYSAAAAVLLTQYRPY